MKYNFYRIGKVSTLYPNNAFNASNFPTFMESIPWYLRLKTTVAEVVFGKKNYTNIL